MTHYIPKFTERFRGQYKAVCETWVPADAHSVQPDCPTCAAYLNDGMDEQRLADALFDQPGDAPPPPRRLPDPDPVEEYNRQYDRRFPRSHR